MKFTDNLMAAIHTAARGNTRISHRRLADNLMKLMAPTTADRRYGP
jgi:hypothetical protein